MKILIPAEANRSISFTNKEAAYFYTQSHLANHPEWTWFEGVNVAKNRVFGGYELFADNEKLNNQTAQVIVYPYKMVRKHEAGRSEELWMFDYRNIIEVSIGGAKQTTGILLKGKDVNFQSITGNVAYFSPMEGKFVIALSPINNRPLQVNGNMITAGADAGGFYISIGKTETEAEAMIDDTRKNSAKLKLERVRRMEDLLLKNTYISSNLDSLDLALNWLQITMDQLVTRQQGDGIYAGLPWFNEYWGRDEFISFPGAILVSGQFATGRKILLSFAEYQQKDPNSRYFGRVPNIVNPQNIDYHTTDGTPRFIIELQDYVKYSGDTSLIRELYPNVIYSIDGALKNWVDARGYLLHEDNETWMDARDANLVPYSPRGSRANDIQALWYNQLRAGAYFAAFMHDDVNRNKWSQLADKLKANFERDFQDASHDYFADRLTREDKADFSLRPNQLFALDMVDDPTLKCKALRKVWEELVYPWGVATLDRYNPLFHPFHLSPDYHKDEAYHNGTIWPWLNGIAMQRMIEAEQVETAYRLFDNMNRQALTMGVVGGMCENMDAYPHPGQAWPKITGTYLQAWSNAEQLRIWNQFFIGIRPDLTNNTLTLAPRIPDAINKLDYSILVGKGAIMGYYSKTKVKTYHYIFKNIGIKAIIDIYPYEIAAVEAEAESRLELAESDDALTLTLKNKNGRIIQEGKLQYSPLRMSRNSTCNQLLQDVKFTAPIDLKNHPVIRNP